MFWGELKEKMNKINFQQIKQPLGLSSEGILEQFEFNHFSRSP